MDAALIYSTVAALIAGLAIQWINIKVAHRFKLLDIPTARRRHVSSTPVTGGVGLFASWTVGIIIYTCLAPDWFKGYELSLLIMGTSVVVLIALGLVDDLKGLSPRWKLSIEFIVAGLVVGLEPQVNAICTHWSGTLGIFVWPMAMIWIVGITNSINLIDGLDGLGGGMSLLVASSITVLSLWTGEQAQFVTVIMLMLVASTSGFLRYNWFPAKVFLGDNGSLPLGFLIAATSLMCRPQSRSWIMIASVVLMLGYPILDMGLAVLRRHKKRFPLFKADRNHLHHRIQRLGLSVPHTAALLLSTGLYLQIASLCINQISPPSAALGIAVVCFSIFSLLHLIRSIERWRVKKIFYGIEHAPQEFGKEAASEAHTIMHIELETLLEAAMFEEQGRCHQLVAALELMLSSMVRPTDVLFKTNQRISIVFTKDRIDLAASKEVEKRFHQHINHFLSLYNLQCSLSGIPITFETATILKRSGTTTIISNQNKRYAA